MNYILDLARDPSRPRLHQQEDGYVHFGGAQQPIESVLQNCDILEKHAAA